MSLYSEASRAIQDLVTHIVIHTSDASPVQKIVLSPEAYKKLSYSMQRNQPRMYQEEPDLFASSIFLNTPHGRVEITYEQEVPVYDKEAYWNITW